MAGVLVHALVGRYPGILSSPRPIPRCRILDREPIQEVAIASAHESLGYLQVLARSLEPSLVGEVRGLDDERLAFPTAHRVAHPPADAGRRMRAADADDARVVD